jgi:leucyl-tRNA---protein transferase
MRAPTSCPWPAAAPPVPVPLTVTPPHPCPYLPNRSAVLRAFRVDTLPGLLYHDFLNASFRRSGKVIYQPACPGCRACLPLKIPVANFRPTRSQRRCRQKNSDLKVTVDLPHSTDEKYDLYQRYQSVRHSSPVGDRKSFEEFLYHSPVQTLEFAYRDPTGRLLAIGICDICSLSLSSVYFWFDPVDAKRGLGTFGVLREIEFAFDLKIADYYIGYWVQGCCKMAYKATFEPHEILYPDGQWRSPPPPKIDDRTGEM